MIVKNEEHIITETLQCMLKHIDYYVISDTGSTDNTKRVISSYFDKHGIPGEIHDTPWVDFGHNRSKAFELAKGKSKYMWVMDADDLIVGNIILPDLVHDAYLLTIGTDFVYKRMLIFKNSDEYTWSYEGVVHEFPKCSKKNIQVAELPCRNYYIDSRRLGSRSKNPDKYLNDAKLLEQELIKDPTNIRNIFYAANSYFDAGQYEKAITYYKKRLAAQTWDEEEYYSQIKMSTAFELLKYPWPDIEQSYYDCYKKYKRAEPLFKLICHYVENNDFTKAYDYCSKAIQLQYPYDYTLFVEKCIYDYQLEQQMSICAFKLNKHVEGAQLLCNILKKNIPTPSLNVNLAKECIAFAKKNITTKETLCIQLITTHKMQEQFANMSEYYEVFVLSNSYVSGNIHRINTFPSNHIFDYYVSFDDLSLFYDCAHSGFIIPAKYKILYLTESVFRIYVKNGLLVDLLDDTILNPIFQQINIIACPRTIHTYITKNYKLNELNQAKIRIFDIFDSLHYSMIFGVTDEPVKIDHVMSEIQIKTPNYHPAISSDILTSFTTTHKYLNSDHVLIFLARYHAQQQQYDTALSLLNTIINNNKTNMSILSFAHFEKAKCLHFVKDYEASFSLFNKILDNNILSHASIAKYEAEQIRDANIDHLKYLYLEYPAKQIQSLTSKSRKRIMLTITTCKRFDLFEQTMNSFINCCQDIHLIDHFLCVDDNSSEEDIIKMKKLYPFFEFVLKTPQQKGHHISMNIIFNKMTQYDPKYILHLEDDWHFIHPRPFMNHCFSIFESDAMIKQVLFNRNYAEIERHKQPITGGIPKTVGSVPYILHEHYATNTDEYETYIRTHPGRTCAYWPHFSFRPSIICCDALRAIGKFANVPHFEMHYANKYVAAGFKSAFYDTFMCIHTGKKTWETDVPNAYNLNGVQQFAKTLSKYSVVIINISPTTKIQYSPSNTKQVVMKFDLSGHERKLCLDNTVNYRRDAISILLSHFEAYNEHQNDRIAILFSNADPCLDFKEKLDALLNGDIAVDVIILDDNAKMIRDGKINFKACLYNTINYIITRSAITKLLAGENVFTAIGVEIVKNTLVIYNRLPSVHGYMFYSCMDSYGSDIAHHDDLTFDQLVGVANNNMQCVAFNTLGYLKSSVCDKKDLICLPMSSKLSDGLYVKDWIDAIVV